MILINIILKSKRIKIHKRNKQEIYKVLLFKVLREEIIIITNNAKVIKKTFPLLKLTLFKC